MSCEQRLDAAVMSVATTSLECIASPTAIAPAAPLLVLEKDASEDPELCALLTQLLERHQRELSASRGVKSIAANLFIGSERRGYFNYGRYKKTMLVYAYTGPDEYFETLALEMLAHCERKGLELSIITHQEISAIGPIAFSATPFGVVQRISNLREFTLEGGAMRRLRYQVSRFERSGACRTEEYRCGTTQATDRHIVEVIDRWSASRTMVNPLIHVVREEILAGRLHARHRVFVTYLDDVLQNVILISPMGAADNGYLMDLEFYGPDMPLGGLEFAIVRIIEKLATEGANVLSLGGTYGCRIGQPVNPDPGIERILDELHQQGIFNDQGNLQFKTKFRPDARSIFLCRPQGVGRPDSVIDIIMMIADPHRTQTSDRENHTWPAPPADASRSRPSITGSVSDRSA
jgi:polyketide synthase PksN